MNTETLTPSMQAALIELVRRPGSIAESYPGGWKSVRALVRRDLARIDGDAIFPTAYGFRAVHHNVGRRP